MRNFSLPPNLGSRSFGSAIVRTSKTSNLITSTKRTRLHLPSFFTSLFCIAVLFFDTPVFAQTFPPLSSCTSKDLELVGATLPAPANDPCQCSGTRTLVLTIANKTGSTRTSFALWGTLVRYNSAGTEISREPIVACAGPIPKTSTTPLASDKDITISCGESLDIVDLYLAWTSASPNETCAVLKANPSTINPKCGTLPLIHVGIGVEAALVTTNATCSAGGSIKVTPSGGVGPYSVALDGGTAVNVSAGSFTTFTDVSAGAHNVVITDSRTCSTTKNPSVGSPATVTADAGTDFTKNCTDNTTGKQIGEASQAGFTYSWSPTTGLSDATVSNPTANPSSNTTYTVTKTNTASGCSDTDDIDVTVNTGEVTAAAGDDFTKNCTDNTTGKQIGETSQAGFTYSWSPTTGLSDATVSNPTANPSSNTTYTVTKTNTSSGCSDTDDITVTVNTSAPSFTVCLVQPDLCNQYGSVTFSASGGSDYRYSIDGGTDFTNTSGIFNNLVSGSVTNFKVKSANGCIATLNCNTTSNCSSGAARMNTNTYQTPEQKIVVEEQAKVTAYPNPFNDRVKFVVTSSVSGRGNLEVFNMLGQKVKTVFQGNIVAGTQTFELSLSKQQLANLIYVFRVGDKKVSGKLLQLRQ